SEQCGRGGAKQLLHGWAPRDVCSGTRRSLGRLRDSFMTPHVMHRTAHGDPSRRSHACCLASRRNQNTRSPSMEFGFTKSHLALAAVAALGAFAMGSTPGTASAAKVAGNYVTGDFHNHTTCSDGSISIQKLVKKATDKVDTPWGLDWFVQAGHGGNGNRNCTLVEDATLETPAYPFLSGPTPFNTGTAQAPSQY